MSDFEPNNCPVGLVHTKELEHQRDILNMAIERLEEHIETVKNDVNKGFSDVNEHFEAVDKRFDIIEKQFDKLQEDLPGTIDSQIKANNGVKALNAFKWIVVTLGGSVTVTIVTRLVLQALHIV